MISNDSEKREHAIVFSSFHFEFLKVCAENVFLMIPGLIDFDGNTSTRSKKTRIIISYALPRISMGYELKISTYFELMLNETI